MQVSTKKSCVPKYSQLAGLGSICRDLSADALAQEDLTSHWTVEVSHPATRSYHALEIACQKEGGGSNGTKWQPTTSN